eukprot:CAMPEP_0183479038 /NCGR_PEP_ID=MMETSP0370-20130417/170977_1 /TAXON_ID=268820 /ORGANISM="Peridinium aciculiferum, Strain PAER-2" /LENGTH=70 /DNA_ID=CAMNT_0025672033 /DNA_START=10 /DNA_END=219 /DNA_ORIENTATION=-
MYSATNTSCTLPEPIDLMGTDADDAVPCATTVLRQKEHRPAPLKAEMQIRAEFVTAAAAGGAGASPHSTG